MSERAIVIGVGAISPFGRGLLAYDVTSPGPAKVAIQREEALEAAGFSRPLVARVPDCLSADAPRSVARDRATHLLYDATRDALRDAAITLEGKRVGFAMGTSSGGMRSAEAYFEAIDGGGACDAETARAASYFAPFEEVALRLLPADLVRKTQLVTACAASTWAIGVGLLWLRAGAVDVAICGGYDAYGAFVHAGFDSLRATSPALPAPFRLGREGMSLGEGAGVLVMVRESDALHLRGASAPGGAARRFAISGFGASSDAVHVTAPDRTGGGLARASLAAIADSGRDRDRCVMVSAHATATPFNDAMEARALQQVFSRDPGVASPVVHPFKAQIGHTLGAAGVLETLAIAHALESGVLPAAAGSGGLDDDAPARLLGEPTAFEDHDAFALKQSAAFGGANAALVVERSSTESAGAPSRTAPCARVAATGHALAFDPDLVAQVSGQPLDKVSRIDPLAGLAATSVARLGASRAELAGAAIVVGHSLATIDINHRFYSRVLKRGPAAAEPRLFPPTSPNLVAGHLSILFGVTGPSAACCGGLRGGVEALEVGLDLLAGGIVERVLVVAVDLLGPTATRLLREGEMLKPGERLADGAFAVLLGPSSGDAPLEIAPAGVALGHLGLMDALLPTA